MSLKKITLFYPLINETPFYPPLGLLTICRPFLEAGYQIKIIDANVEGNFQKKLLVEVSNSICLGVSLILGNQVKSGFAISCLVKKHFPNLPIIWGGWFPTLMYEQILQNKNVDFIIRGQGEEAFPKLVKCLEERENFREIPSLAYKEEEKIIANEIQFVKNIQPIKREAYHLISMESYIQKNLAYGKRILGYVSSIGCYGRCGFCCLPSVFGRNRYYALSAEQVINDLKYLISYYQVTHIDILDFNFFVNRKRAKKILKDIYEENLNITWNANIRVDQVLHLDDEFLSYLKKSGVNLLYIGAESGSNRMLDLITKDISVSDIEKCSQILRKYNLRPSYSFIPGIMKEDQYKDLDKTFDLILKIKNIDPNCLISIHYYSPWIGTSAFKIAQECGFKTPTNLISWTKFRTENVVVPWISFRYEMRVVKFFRYYLKILYPSSNFVKVIQKYRLTFFYYLLRFIISLRVKYKFYYFDPIWGLILIYKLLKKCYQKIKYINIKYI